MKKKMYESPSVFGIEMTIEMDVIAGSPGTVDNYGSGGDIGDYSNVQSTREFSLIDNQSTTSEFE